MRRAALYKATLPFLKGKPNPLSWTGEDGRNANQGTDIYNKRK